jgi:O-methyltransferase involved in polyketide biosynthesis
MLCTGRPAAAFYPKDELDGDPTNWWGLNEKAVEAMLKEVGFREVRLVYRSPLWWRIGRACKLMLKGRNPFVSVNQARLVYHAYK